MVLKIGKVKKTNKWQIFRLFLKIFDNSQQVGEFEKGMSF